ncbi:MULTISPECIES: PaaI family thioesterase [Actinoalloteichus]|uniref:Domain 1-containing protein n=1 Tax=Actinoalloteichus caeruleus DSM 43889 TaxID=1120930 RepID=A0ABT1JGN3_ACTCY|nr:PaaI family thioesterase [Actinoalloteichus caeruleus]MCP2331632.1 putative domain 1-containing protein [Actinoalloteichus caeruleus DSM 43889]
MTDRADTASEHPRRTGPTTDPTEVERLLRQGPFHEWLGLRVLSVGEDRIELAFAWRPEWVADPDAGYTHGGILATIVDLTADWALVSRLGRGVPTVDMRVDYHRAASRGEDLTAVGEVVRFGRTLAVAEARVHDGQGRLVASGRGLYHTASASS